MVRVSEAEPLPDNITDGEFHYAHSNDAVNAAKRSTIILPNLQSPAYPYESS